MQDSLSFSQLLTPSAAAGDSCGLIAADAAVIIIHQFTSILFHLRCSNCHQLLSWEASAVEISWCSCYSPSSPMFSCRFRTALPPLAQTFWNLKKNINNNKVFDRIINCSVIKGCKTNAVLIETKTSSPMSDRYSAFMTEDGKSNLRSFEPKNCRSIIRIHSNNFCYSSLHDWVNSRIPTHPTNSYTLCSIFFSISAIRIAGSGGWFWKKSSEVPHPFSTWTLFH